MRINRDGKLGKIQGGPKQFTALANQLKQDDRLSRDNPSRPHFAFTCDESSLILQLSDSAFARGLSLDHATVRMSNSNDGHKLAVANLPDGSQVIGAVAADRPMRRLKRKMTPTEAKSMMQLMRAF